MNKLRLPDRLHDTLATTEDVAMLALALAVSATISPLARIKQHIDAARTSKELSQTDPILRSESDTQAVT